MRVRLDQDHPEFEAFRGDKPIWVHEGCMAVYYATHHDLRGSIFDRRAELTATGRI